MLFIAFIFFLLCANMHAMESNTLITFLPHDYTFDSLEDCGTMAYCPIQISVLCPYIDYYCTKALNDTSWWQGKFEPKPSLYVKKFVNFGNETTSLQQNYNRIETLIGSFCLKIIAITLKKALFRSLQLTHYQTSIIRTNTFDPEAPTSVFIENNWLEIFENQRTSLPLFLNSFARTFDPIFFDHLKHLIELFDDNIKKIKFNNSDFKKTEENLQSFLEKFDKILADHAARKRHNQIPNQMMQTVFTPFALLLAYMFDFKC